ncbi:MAG: chemotaxis protein CheX [Spirochaetes bacterium]|nr:chemotaxis protein CheX [Spirochaetota bacterium]
MDTAIINPFLSAAVSVFRNMFSLDVQSGKPFIVEYSGNHRWDISGIIGLAGSAQGIIAIRIGRDLAGSLLKASGVETSGGDEMICGLIAELTNIISGNATTALSGIDVEISPPVVIQGANHQISWPRIAPVIGIPFTTPNGPFEVDVCFKR